MTGRFAVAAIALPAAALMLAGCGSPYGYGRATVADTRVDPVNLGAPPSLDPGITRRAGGFIRPSGPFIQRPVYRAPVF